LSAPPFFFASETSRQIYPRGGVLKLTKGIEMAQHGSPYDRGSADRYYGRSFNPHHRLNGEEVTDLTPEQIAEYRAGWNEESGSKDWGTRKTHT